MAIDVSQNISTLGEALTAMAPYAGGSVPPSSDPEYDNWVGWINQGQEDAAGRGFWQRLLQKTSLTIPANDDTIDLPDNFHKRNGIYVLDVDGVDWADQFNSDGQKLLVHLKPTTATWELMLKDKITAEATATLWYFYLPPKLEDESDPLYLDGKMVVYYALTEYYRQSGELGSLDDARLEYTNRFQENLALEMIPSKYELLSWSSNYDHQNINVNERAFYAGRNRRTRRR